MNLAPLSKARPPNVTYKSYDTQYTGLSTTEDDFGYEGHEKPAKVPTVDLTEHPQISLTRSWRKTLVLSFFSFLWLVPIAFLLMLNTKGYIIGPSAWCPLGHCSLDFFDSAAAFHQRAKFDHENHNLLGALQFIAKALEVWFILIATLLVYLLTMILAGQKEGLPIAYLTRPSEFAEIPGLMDALLWRTLPPLSRKHERLGAPKSAKKRVWIFVFFTVFLCAICNLMGPAVAVLILPTLQWLDNQKFGDDVFVSLNSASPPRYHGFAWTDTACNAGDFNASKYSCTDSAWAGTMDALVEVYIASQRSWNGISQQDDVSFTFNATYEEDGDSVSNYVFWSPSRQLMQGLSQDWNTFYDINYGSQYNETEMNITLAEYESYVACNHSLDVDLIREGPVTGVLSNMWLGYDNRTFWDTQISTDKHVRCYENYNLSNTPLVRDFVSGDYTKCVKWGTGWNTAAETVYKYTNFVIQGQWKPWLNAYGPSLFFETWSSGYNGAAFLPDGKLPAKFDGRCLPRNASVPAGVTCDWDALFSVDEGSAVANRSAHSNTIQISANAKPVAGHPTTITLMVDFTALLAFTNYSLDPSPLSNPLLMIQQPDLPLTGTPIPVDPSWTLAAWSADAGGTLGANRSSTIELLKVFDDLWVSEVYNDTDPLTNYYATNVDYVSLIPVIQTLSLIEYFTNSSSETDAQPAVSDRNPKLIRRTRMNVWSYGLSSRTSYLGFIVALAGCVVVLFQFGLGLVDRRRYRSPAQLLVAALEHSPQAEFKGKEHDEEAIAKVPFRVEDVHHNAGKLKFGKTT